MEKRHTYFPYMVMIKSHEKNHCTKLNQSESYNWVVCHPEHITLRIQTPP